MTAPVAPEKLKARLITDGLITEEQFEELKKDAQHRGHVLTDTLISQAHVDPGYLKTITADILGVPVANIDSSLDESMVKRLPEAIARQRQVILFKQEEDGSIGVAMVNPVDLDTITFLKQYLGHGVVPYLVDQDGLNRGYQIYGMQTASDFTKIIEENVRETLQSNVDNPEEVAASLPIVAIANSLLSYAATLETSDIHVEALEDATLIRYRIDGLLREVMRLPKEVHQPIIARIKLLSGLKIDEHFRPQDGRFRYQMVNQSIDCRVSILPTYYGEKVVMRLLAATDKPLSLEELGIIGAIGDTVRSNIKKAYGMILVTGPTGSGKSTTLYALLNILNQTDVNIVTVEDPVEYNMRYVNQSQINPAAGVTFASGIRSILRQDPDIIMVGEVRDSETADISVQAALTGHLVLTTLHTNDAPTAIPRLVDLEVPPFLAASVLNAIIAQRLVRRICPQCIYSYEPDQAIIDTITKQLVELGVPEDHRQVPKTLFRGKGCDACHGNGYKGRVGIYEVLEASEGVKRLISQEDFDMAEVKTLARTEGMRSMFEDGLNKAQQAMTTVEEILRVIRE